jgi:hypothetical protein
MTCTVYVSWVSFLLSLLLTGHLIVVHRTLRRFAMCVIQVLIYIVKPCNPSSVIDPLFAYIPTGFNLQSGAALVSGKIIFVVRVLSLSRVSSTA